MVVLAALAIISFLIGFKLLGILLLFRLAVDLINYIDDRVMRKKIGKTIGRVFDLSAVARPDYEILKESRISKIKFLFDSQEHLNLAESAGLLETLRHQIQNVYPMPVSWALSNPCAKG